MTEEFVKYEQALALKELGYDIPSFGGYYNDSLAYWKRPINHNESNRKVTAPLYQQAFRWFREKYNLYTYVKYDSSKYYWFAYVDEITATDNNQISKHLRFEEAQQACLEELIKIVKDEKIQKS